MRRRLIAKQYTLDDFKNIDINNISFDIVNKFQQTFLHTNISKIVKTVAILRNISENDEKNILKNIDEVYNHNKYCHDNSEIIKWEDVFSDTIVNNSILYVLNHNYHIPNDILTNLFNKISNKQPLYEYFMFDMSQHFIYKYIMRGWVSIDDLAHPNNDKIIEKAIMYPNINYINIMSLFEYLIELKNLNYLNDTIQIDIHNILKSNDNNLQNAINDNSEQRIKLAYDLLKQKNKYFIQLLYNRDFINPFMEHNKKYINDYIIKIFYNDSGKDINESFWNIINKYYNDIITTYIERTKANDDKLIMTYQQYQQLSNDDKEYFCDCLYVIIHNIIQDNNIIDFNNPLAIDYYSIKAKLDELISNNIQKLFTDYIEKYGQTIYQEYQYNQLIDIYFNGGWSQNTLYDLLTITDKQDRKTQANKIIKEIIIDIIETNEMDNTGKNTISDFVKQRVYEFCKLTN